MTGRQPLSPVDAWLTTHGSNTTASHEQHLEELTKLKGELHDIARANDYLSRMKRQERYDKGAKRNEIEAGDYVLERNESRTDSLDPKYKGPFQVMEHRGANLKIKRGRGPKWVHDNICKLYRGGGNTTTTVTYAIPDCSDNESNIGHGDENMESGTESEHPNFDGVPNMGIGDITEDEEPELNLDSVVTSGDNGAQQQHRRYPLRNTTIT